MNANRNEVGVRQSLVDDVPDAILIISEKTFRFRKLFSFKTQNSSILDSVSIIEGIELSSSGTCSKDNFGFVGDCAQPQDVDPLFLDLLIL
jgi:hypothetical protein